MTPPGDAKVLDPIPGLAAVLILVAADVAALKERAFHAEAAAAALAERVAAVEAMIKTEGRA